MCPIVNRLYEQNPPILKRTCGQFRSIFKCPCDTGCFLVKCICSTNYSSSNVYVTQSFLSANVSVTLSSILKFICDIKCSIPKRNNNTSATSKRYGRGREQSTHFNIPRRLFTRRTNIVM